MTPVGFRLMFLLFALWRINKEQLEDATPTRRSGCLLSTNEREAFGANVNATSRVSLLRSSSDCRSHLSRFEKNNENARETRGGNNDITQEIGG